MLARAADPLNGTVVGVMKRAIQDCQRRTVKVPHKFYEEKHRLEAQLRKAKRTNRLQLQFPNWARFRSATRRNKWIEVVSLQDDSAAKSKGTRTASAQSIWLQDVASTV